MMGITFTFDLEDHRVAKIPPQRYDGLTRQILDFLEEAGVFGSFFVVGTVADESKNLIRTIADRGHEIAFHSWDHLTLDKETESQFREQTRKGKALLEELTGRQVKGYRAPVFSLTSRTKWCVEILKELDFLYSSSVMPASNPLYGYPNAPLSPFRWPNGLLEFPVPTARFLGIRIPYLGGIYLRYLPRRLIQHFAGQNDPSAVLFTYIHPYDFDAEEGLVRIKGASPLTSLLLSLNRAATYSKVEDLFTSGSAPSLGQIAEGASIETLLPTFEEYG